MGDLSDLVGRPLDQISDEELEEIVMKGRLAREDEAAGAAKGRSRKAAAPKEDKYTVNLDDYD